MRDACNCEICTGQNSFKTWFNLVFQVFICPILLLVILFCLVGTAHCETPIKSVEHDPGAWAFTSAATSVGVGVFTRPWIGFASGVAVGAFSNMQSSKNAQQNIVGAAIGSAAGYFIIKTLKQDWRKRNANQQ